MSNKIPPISPNAFASPRPTQAIPHKNTDSEGVNSATVRVEESTIIDEVNDNLLYVGYADLGASLGEPVWKIKRVQTIGTITTVKYADGNKFYDNIWDNRGSLNYL